MLDDKFTGPDGAIKLSLDDTFDTPTIDLFGATQHNQGISQIYETEEGIVLRAGDGTRVCIWNDRIGLCEIKDSGFLRFRGRRVTLGVDSPERR